MNIDDMVKFIHPDERERFLHQVANLSDHPKRTAQYRCKFTREYQCCEILNKNKCQKDNIHIITGLLQNIQEVKDKEEELIQARNVAERAELKQSFLDNMSHEIRTPLNAINGFSELLLTEQKPAARQAFQAEIWKSTTALTALLENMLELSQLVSSESPLPVAQTDIRLLCAERLELQKQLGDNPAVEYVNEAGTESEIPTNAFYLTRVVDNLLHNAAKFTAAGRITLRCRNDEPRRTLQISVSDTGIGIPPEKQEWVFERFTKVDPFKPGSGIGLYLCRLIVTRLGGDIRVCPEYSGGCCIRIELPY